MNTSGSGRQEERMGSSKAARAASKASYHPGARFELEVSEVEYRRTTKGRSLMARIYQPVGSGPFPVVLDLHGGAWNLKDRRAEERFDRALASAGALVVAVDLTLAPEAPYPASMQDANYAVRWLKTKAGAWNGDASRIGVFGSSTGGHLAELLAMRPRDPRYNAFPLQENPAIEATVDYVLARSPISNPFERFQNMQAMKNAPMVKFHETFFVPWETIHEANPHEILDRREAVSLKPLLIMQGALDRNVFPALQTRFVDAYRAAGGSCDYTIFEDCDHEWVATPGPQTDRAYEMAKAFIARQVNAGAV
jgi:acetyl esterase/lipase